MTTLKKLEKAAKAATVYKIIDRNMIYDGDKFVALVRVGDADEICKTVNELRSTILALCERERQRDALVVELVSLFDEMRELDWFVSPELAGRVVCVLNGDDVRSALAKAASFTAKDASEQEAAQ